MNSSKPAHERYVFKPFVGSSHSWAIEKLHQLSPEKSVLDIGSGSGAMGNELKARGITDLFAIEIDPNAAAAVKEIYKQVATDISAFEGRKFDAILLMDILEHLSNPFEYLKKVSSLLNSGGFILISLPNVAHWSVRFSLLFGVMNYKERGILDKTHLQFFTRRRAKELVASDPSLRLEQFDVSIEPIELLLPRTIWDNPIFAAISKLRQATARIIPGLCSFQHLMYVKKI